MANRAFTLFGLLAAFVFVEHHCFADPSMTVREKTVVGHELRLIVETSTTSQEPDSHSATTSDVKGYLVVVDLASKKPIGERSQAYGPLYDVPQPRSQISFASGAKFTKEDEEAALATPECVFDENGDLIRFRTDLAHRQYLFDRLNLATRKYKDAAVIAPIGDRTPPMSEDEVITRSRRYMLLYQDGKARLFDLLTGKEKEDKWLTDRFAESRQIPAFKNVRMFLTDDLDHLVVSPRALWNEGGGGPAMHTTFDFGGKALDRKKYFLCADRPEASLGLVERKKDEQEFLAEAPGAAFTIDHQLILMFATKESIRLYRRDGSVVFHSEAKVPGGWQNGELGTCRLPADGRLLFFTHDFERMDMDQVMGRHVALTTWDYRRNEVTSEVVPIVDLFRVEDDHYVLRAKPNPLK